MSKTATYSLIQSQTLGSATTTVTFSSIPATFTDLVLVSNILGSGPQYARYRFNGDTGTNYSFTVLSGDGTSATSGRASSQSGLNMALNNTNTLNTLNILDYSNSTTYKTALAKRGDASFGIDVYAGLWRSTSAINSIEIYSPNNLNTNSTFRLYGVEAYK